MRVLRAVNGVVMFTLELAAYLAVGAAGWHFGDGGLRGAAYAVLGVVVMAAIWGIWAAPKAARPLGGWGRILFEALWFGVAAGGVLWLGWPQRAGLLVGVWLVNLALRRAAGQLPPGASSSG